MTTTSPLFIVLFGAQGSGKGTQARLLQDEFGVPQVATGDLFRHNLRNQTELGQLAQSYMDRGELVPDDVTNSMVEARLQLDDTAGGAIFDGYPRNIAQARALDQILARREAEINRAVFINVDHDTLMARLTGRRVCRNCQATYHVIFNPPAVEGVCDRCGGPLYQRDDDKDEDAIRRRLELYFEETMPVIDWYREEGLLTEVDGSQSIEDVHESIVQQLQ